MVNVIMLSARNTRLFRLLCQELDADYMKRYYSTQKGPLVVTEEPDRQCDGTIGTEHRVLYPR